jgi:predicted ATPase
MISHVAVLALHGRDTELAALQALIESAGDGGGAVVVRGDAGIGKSTVLAAARRSAESAGIAVIAAGGVQSEAHLPFAGLHQLLQPLLGELDALPGRHRAALEAAFGMSEDAAPNPFLIALATLELLGEAASRSPLLVLAEDAHWLDQPTSDVLAFVARRVSAEPIVVLLAVRDGEGNPFAGADLPEMRLEPLDSESAAELLDAHAPGLPPAARERLLAESAGNPLALVELPSALEAELGEAPLLPEHLPLSARLERAFAARLPELPEEACALLLAAAADGRSALDEALRASGLVLGRELAAGALDPAVELGLVDPAGAEIRFRHPLVRSAIYRAAGTRERHAMHAALAEVVADDPDRSAWHRAAATAAPDEAVAADLEASAERARRRGAVATAVAAFQRAADLSSGHEQARRLLLGAELAFELGRRDITLPLLAKAEPLELTPLQRGRMAFIREVLDPRPLDAAKVRFLSTRPRAPRRRATGSSRWTCCGSWHRAAGGASWARSSARRGWRPPRRSARSTATCACWRSSRTSPRSSAGTRSSPPCRAPPTRARSTTRRAG